MFTTSSSLLREFLLYDKMAPPGHQCISKSFPFRTLGPNDIAAKRPGKDDLGQRSKLLHCKAQLQIEAEKGQQRKTWSTEFHSEPNSLVYDFEIGAIQINLL
ncbi:hypothetical protein L2E82_31580 [Cichorium intybus]|uniref:Uncharacterized protein n=1 Tax=Cichorium intybus TaxID=13427 RepID=A0ACB9BEB1_CICIN|nr:hypothetical protein L2E82_31580 [Cichorium intybus]